MERAHKNTVRNISICILSEKRDKDWQVYIDHRDISIQGSRMPDRIALNRFSGAEIWNSRDSWNQWKRLHKVIFQIVFFPSSLSHSLSLPLLWKIIFLNLLLRGEQSRKRNLPERHEEFDGDVTRERKYSLDVLMYERVFVLPAGLEKWKLWHHINFLLLQNWIASAVTRRKSIPQHFPCGKRTVD